MSVESENEYIDIPIPEDFFQVVAAFLPRLIEAIQESCDLEPIEFYILFYIRQSGNRREGGGFVCPRQKLTEVLTREFRSTPAAVTKLITGLHNAGLVSGENLTEFELEQLFGIAQHRKAVVVLRPGGLDKINQFKDSIQKAFDRTLRLYPAKYSHFVAAAISSPVGKQVLAILRNSQQQSRNST